MISYKVIARSILHELDLIPFDEFSDKCLLLIKVSLETEYGKGYNKGKEFQSNIQQEPKELNTVDYVKWIAVSFSIYSIVRSLL